MPRLIFCCINFWHNEETSQHNYKWNDELVWRENEATINQSYRKYSAHSRSQLATRQFGWVPVAVVVSLLFVEQFHSHVESEQGTHCAERTPLPCFHFARPQIAFGQPVHRVTQVEGGLQGEQQVVQLVCTQRGNPVRQIIISNDAKIHYLWNFKTMLGRKGRNGYNCWRANILLNVKERGGGW